MSASHDIIKTPFKYLSVSPMVVEDQQLAKVYTTARDTALASMESRTAPDGLVTVSNDSLAFNGIDSRGLRFGPPEIREMIFKHYFVDHFFLHFDKTPILFAALRKDKSLYEEAARAFSKFCTFRICWEDEAKGELPPYSVIQKLEIRINHGRGNKSNQILPGQYNRRHIGLSCCIRSHADDAAFKILTNGTSITELTLDVSRGAAHDDWSCEDREFRRVLTRITRLPMLRKFTLILGRDQYWFGDDQNDGEFVNGRFRDDQNDGEFFNGQDGIPLDPVDNRPVSKWIDLATYRTSLENVFENQQYENNSHNATEFGFTPAEKNDRSFDVTDVVTYPGEFRTKRQGHFFEFLRAGLGFHPKYKASCVPWLQYEYVWELSTPDILTWTPWSDDQWKQWSKPSDWQDELFDIPFGPSNST